jgi:cell division protein FtsX
MTAHPVLLLLALAAILVAGNWILAAMAAREASKESPTNHPTT